MDGLLPAHPTCWQLRGYKLELNSAREEKSIQGTHRKARRKSLSDKTVVGKDSTIICLPHACNFPCWWRTRSNKLLTLPLQTLLLCVKWEYCYQTDFFPQNSSRRPQILLAFQAKAVLMEEFKDNETA